MGGRRVEVGTRMTRIGWMNMDWFDGLTPDGIWTLMTRIGYDFICVGQRTSTSNF